MRPLEIGITVLYYFVLHDFFAPNGIYVVFYSLSLLCVFYIRLMRTNKVETCLRLLTCCNKLLFRTVWMLVVIFEQRFKEYLSISQGCITHSDIVR